MTRGGPYSDGGRPHREPDETDGDQTQAPTDPDRSIDVERDGLRYDTVLWDIGGVIVDLSSVREGYAAFVSELADEHDLDADVALDDWKTTLGEHFRDREATEYRAAREGYRKATAGLFDGDPPDDWEATFQRATDATLRPEDGAVETIRRLAAAGVQQAIVSDIDTREAHSMLQEFGLADCFAHVTTSEDVGYTKPDGRMFADALAAVDADPESTLMVGDRYDHDVAGAAEFGIDAAAYGADARGPAATYEIDDLRELVDVVGVGD